MIMENILTILKGTMISIILTLILLFIFATILTYTTVGENTIPAVIIVITAISLLIGSSIVGRKARKNGLLNGAIIGIIYLLLIYCISSILGGDFSMNLQSIIMIIVGMVFGILGGIVGVNTKKWLILKKELIFLWNWGKSLTEKEAWKW